MEENIEKYKQFRTSTFDLVNHKLIPFISNNYYNELVISSAKKLDMLQGKKNIILDNEEDSMYIFDFALNEVKINGKNGIQLYKEEVGAQNEMEQKVIDALENSYTSTFRVINT